MAKSMHKLTPSNEERDVKQRSMGFIGFSAFMHMALLIVVLLAPSLKTPKGQANGTSGGVEMTGEQIAVASPTANTAAANSTAANLAAGSAPSEVFLADASDTDAVALPPSHQLVEEKSAEAKLTETAPVQAPVAKPQKPVAKVAKVKAPKAAAADISSALAAARTDAAKNPKAAAAKAPKAIEVADNSPVEIAESQDATPAPESDEQPALPSRNQVAQNDEPVPLEIALPESEALSDEEAAALQAPKIPYDAQPIETVSSMTSSPSVSASQPASRVTGLITTKPARIAGLARQSAQPTILAANGSGTGALVGTGTTNTRGASGGGTQGAGLPLGAPVRDARSLIATEKPQPVYPLQDRIGHHEGTAVLVGHVTNDGRVERVTLEKSSGSRSMDESAAKAFSQWKFKSGQEGLIRLPIQFQLAGAEKIIPAELNRQ